MSGEGHVSWAAHEFENYWLQKHVGVKASFLAIVIGALSPDLFTKAFVYGSDNPASFHRGWPGVGFTHSFIFGVVLALIVLTVTKSRAWALGLLIGQWAHVATDVADTAGVMPFFPFSTESVTISMWKHAAAEGRYGDAAAYYSSLGGVWDLFWLVVVLIFARQTLKSSYFRGVVVPADPWVWGWFHTRLKLPATALVWFYRGFIFYGLGRMITWFLYARFGARTPFQPWWGGPEYVPGTDLSDAGIAEMLIRTAVGGLFFAAFCWLVWMTIGRRLWARGHDTPAAEYARGLIDGPATPG
jgi:membrane-bound metal-dependent hydrolase YbcI (DUF457 family)